MANRCGWCSLADREELERRVLSGEAVRLVAADTPYSSRAAFRHMRAHVAPDFLAEARSRTAAVHVSDFAARLAELTDETALVRSYALDKGFPRLLLEAVKAERDTIAVLMGRLGLDSSQTVSTLREGKVFAQAVGRVLRSSSPDLARQLAADLDAHGEGELASAVGKIADRPALREIEEANKTKEPA